MNAWITNPRTSEDFAHNARLARVAAAGPLQLGSTIKTGAPAEFAALSQADQVRLTDEVASFIVGNQKWFSDRQIELARSRVHSASFRSPLASTRIDAVDFVKAYGETFGETVVAAAGVAGRSLEAIGLNVQTFLIVASVVAVLYFGAPYVLPKIRDALRKK